MPWSWRDRPQEAVPLRSPIGGELGVSCLIGGELSVPPISWNRSRRRRPRDSAVRGRYGPVERYAAASSQGAPRLLITRWGETRPAPVDGVRRLLDLGPAAELLCGGDNLGASGGRGERLLPAIAECYLNLALSSSGRFDRRIPHSSIGRAFDC
jgi:hypothetical protein